MGENYGVQDGVKSISAFLSYIIFQIKEVLCALEEIIQ